MHWERCKVDKNYSIFETMEIIDKSAFQIALVVDEKDKLMGIVTDGDIRRAVLRRQSLDEPITSIMNEKPVAVQAGQERHAVIAKLQDHGLSQAPVVDRDGVVIDLVLLKNLTYEPTKENAVVLMVGGLGTRLRPLTDQCPKPLLKVGNKPILETILENFIESGFRNFYFAVNYKAEMIEEYFGDGSQYGVQIQYMYEKKRMGTAGALSLLPEEMKHSVIVMNGDLLTKVNFEQLLRHHDEEKAWATMAVREYSYQIPYGVIQMKKNKIIDIQEKPIKTYFVNAGIYVLSPEAIAKIDKDKFLDMTDLFYTLIADGKIATVFPIREYWLDIGRMDDFEKAQKEYVENF